MKSKPLFLLMFFFLLLSCKNHYNEMIAWTDTIPKGSSVESVKKIQPGYLEIDWNNPDIFENETRYSITKIKNDYDALGMENYLSFVDGKYQGRFAHK